MEKLLNTRLSRTETGYRVEVVIVTVDTEGNATFAEPIFFDAQTSSEAYSQANEYFATQV